MDNIQKNIRRVFWLYFLLFFMILAYLGKYVFFDSKTIVTNPYNARLKLNDGSVIRGAIKDRSGEILAETVEQKNGLQRVYPHGRSFAHVVGFSGAGGSGLEAKYNFKLQGLSFEIWQRLRNILWDEPLRGQDLILTLDAGLQEYAMELLGKQKGAIVVMEPSTGKILAMVSNPGFNPNTIEQNWNTLRADEENSPLLNRAVQGLYPPGSVFKIATTLAGLPEAQTEEYDCDGRFVYEGSQIRCSNGTAHGHLNLETAFALSCNGFFSQLGLDTGGDRLRTTADRLLWNTSYPFSLDVRVSTFPLNGEATADEIMETSIGQGRTLTTPLHVAMLTSAVANGGILMQPYLVDSVGESLVGKSMPQKLGRLMSSEEAMQLSDMMSSVVTSGTALKANVQGIQVAGKTGSAETDSGEPHGWFTAFAPAQKPEIVVTVLLENSGGSGKCLPIAKEIIQYYN